ncbi:hypothetical protein CsSME_00035382 [Camellia sinensis var. sinensis]
MSMEIMSDLMCPHKVAQMRDLGIHTNGKKALAFMPGRSNVSVGVALSGSFRPRQRRQRPILFRRSLWNRALIQQVNENHQSKMPDNLVKNVALIREINRNISKVISLYSNLFIDFSNIIQQRRAINNDDHVEKSVGGVVCLPATLTSSNTSSFLSTASSLSPATGIPNPASRTSPPASLLAIQITTTIIASDRNRRRHLHHHLSIA